MRVFFLNLHTNDFVVKTMSAILARKKVPTRHRPLIKGLCERGVEVFNVVTDGTFPWHMLPVSPSNIKKRKFNLWEARYVLKENGLADVDCITELPDIHQDDIMIIYSHFDVIDYKDFFDKPWIQIIDFTHFYGYRNEARFLEKIQPDAYMCEVNLSKTSGLYNKYYGGLKAKYINRPFSYETRFKRIIDFDDRLNRVCAMGNIARLNPIYPKHRDYIRFYHKKFMQPLRKQFYDKKEDLDDMVDCYSTIGVDTIKKYSVSEADSVFSRNFKLWWNYFQSERFPKYYRSFDMVETYNKYKLVVNECDSNGIYAIGAIEAMACGCVLVATYSQAYNELGLRDGVTYIAYDGTITDFRKKVSYWLAEDNKEGLKKIAEAGYEYVRERFSDETISELYYKVLKRLKEEVK